MWSVGVGILSGRDVCVFVGGLGFLFVFLGGRVVLGYC